MGRRTSGIWGKPTLLHPGRGRVRNDGVVIDGCGRVNRSPPGRPGVRGVDPTTVKYRPGGRP